jgi:hypothetical protein
MHILWVIAKVFFLLSLAPAVGVLVGFPLFLLSERIKILWADQPVAAHDGLVSLVRLG